MLRCKLSLDVVFEAMLHTLETRGRTKAMISTFDEMVSLLLEMQEDGSTGYQTAIEDMLLKAGVRFVPWAERTCGLQLGRN